MSKTIKHLHSLGFTMKVALLVGLMTVATAISLGLIGYQGLKQIIYDTAIERLKHDTQLKSAQLLSTIQNLEQDVQYLAGTPPISGISRSLDAGGIDPRDGSTVELWENRLATIFTELLRAKRTYLQVRLIGVEDGGRELVRVDRRGMTVRTVPKSALQQKNDEKYFTEAVKHKPGSVYLSEANLNREHGKISEPKTPVMRAATLVYFENKLFGMVIINIDLTKTLDDYVSHTPRLLIPYITNEEGYFLAHPDRKKTFGFDLGRDDKITDLYPTLLESLKKDQRDNAITVKAEKTVIHFVKVKYDSVNDQRFLGVAMAKSNADLLKDATALRNYSIIVVSVMVVICFTLAIFITTRMLSSVNLVTKASRDLAAGKTIGKLPLDQQDEIGELARSFNTMHKKLEAQKQELLQSQASMLHANKMSSLGEMASGMAHEINSPLQAISLTAKRVKRMAEKGAFDGLPKAMDSVENSLQKATNIIESLRKMSRDSSRDNAAYITTGEIIDDVVGMTSEKYLVNNIDFRVEYHNGAHENMELHCQRLQIGQILVNLLNNAFDAIQDTAQKWIKLDIDIADNQLKISVTDSGSGIPADTQDKIFDPMFTTKEIGKGTGLGLSISSQIAEKNQGRLYLDKSAANTTFVLILPFPYSVDGDPENVIPMNLPLRS